MVENVQSDQVLWMIYLAIVIIIPGIVLWSDDGHIHANQKRGG